MANTTFVDIYDLFMMLQNDYRLVALYNDDIENSTTNLDDYLEGWLMFSIGDFSQYCTQDLEDRTDADSTFDIELTTENKTILAKYMVQYWLEKEVHDILQMRSKVQDRDFKTYSEAQNLTAKSNVLSKVKEELSQRIIDYGYKNADWETWVTDGFLTLP